METLLKEQTQVDSLLLARELPVSAVVTDEKFRVLYRNRFAQRLLPPLSRMKSLLVREGKKRGGERIFTMEWEEISYVVLFFSVEEKRRLAVFLEDTTLLHLPFNRALLECGADYLEEICRDELIPSDTPEEKREKLADRLSARSIWLRNRFRFYYRSLLSLPEEGEKPVAVSLTGLMRTICEKVSEGRTRLSMRDEMTPNAATVAPPVLLVTLVLNLLRFAMIFSGADEMEVRLFSEEERHVLRFSFDDGEGLFSRMFAALQGIGPDEKGEKVMGLLPLLAAMEVCRRSGYALDLESSKGHGVLTLRLALTTALPEAFMGSEESEEVKSTEKLARKIFF